MGSVLRSMWVVRLGLPMIFWAWDYQNKSTFLPLILYDAKTTFFSRSSKMSLVFLRFSIYLSFDSRGTHLPVFWIFPIFRNLSKTARWLSSNCSASCFSVCESSSINNACNLRMFWRFSTFLVFFLVLCQSHHFWNAEIIVHTYLVMEHVHHNLLGVIAMIQRHFSSNKNRKLMPSVNTLCSV